MISIMRQIVTFMLLRCTVIFHYLSLLDICRAWRSTFHQYNCHFRMSFVFLALIAYSKYINRLQTIIFNLWIKKITYILLVFDTVPYCFQHNGGTSGMRVEQLFVLSFFISWIQFFLGKSIIWLWWGTRNGRTINNCWSTSNCDER